MARAHKHNPSVSRDFILLFIVIMMVIALVSLWVAYKTFENYTESTISEMEGEALRIDRSLIVEIKSSSYLLESLARQIIQIGASDKESISELLRSFDNKDTTNRNDEFLWVDAKQKVIISSGAGILPKAIDASDRDYVKKSFAAPWQVHIGRPVRGRISEAWVLPISLGITDYKGKFAGIIVLSIHIERLTKELAEVVQQSGMEFAVFTNTLALITDSQKEESISPFSDTIKKLSDKNFDEKTSGVLSKPELFTPTRVFSYYEVSPQFPYVIYISYDQIANEDKIFSLLQARLIQILVIAIFLLSLLWMVRTRVIRPVEQLSEITSDISGGRGYRPLPKGGPIEIENLSHQIKKLSDYITEQHRIEQELNLKNHFLTKLKETAQLLTKVRSDFLHVVAKELEQPLNALLPNLQSIKDQHFGPIDNARYIEQAGDAFVKVHQLRQMIEDIRLIAELEYGNITLKESSVNISFAIHRALRQFHDYQQFKHVEVKLNIADNLPTLLIDEDRFTQVILNLLCGAGATLTQGSAIVFSVQNDYSESGDSELGIQIKYASHLHAPETHFDTTLLSHGDMQRQAEKAPLVKSESISFALARMLISLYDGGMKVTMAKNDVNRIHVSFPKERLIS